MKLIIEEHDVGLEIDLTKIFEATRQRTGYEKIDENVLMYGSAEIPGIAIVKNVDDKKNKNGSTIETSSGVTLNSKKRKKPGPKKGFKKLRQLKEQVAAIASGANGPVPLSPREYETQ